MFCTALKGRGRGSSRPNARDRLCVCVEGVYVCVVVGGGCMGGVCVWGVCVDVFVGDMSVDVVKCQPHKPPTRIYIPYNNPPPPHPPFTTYRIPSTQPSLSHTHPSHTHPHLPYNKHRPHSNNQHPIIPPPCLLLLQLCGLPVQQACGYLSQTTAQAYWYWLCVETTHTILPEQGWGRVCRVGCV